MKRWIHASTDNDKVAKLVREDIKERVKSAAPGPAYIDGDEFAYSQDEVVFKGTFSHCIEVAKEAIAKNPDLIDDIGAAFSRCMDMIYDIDEIVDLFEKHGVDIPDWYLPDGYFDNY